MTIVSTVPWNADIRKAATTDIEQCLYGGQDCLGCCTGEPADLTSQTRTRPGAEPEPHGAGSGQQTSV